jgi:hypothetical protein
VKERKRLVKGRKRMENFLKVTSLLYLCRRYLNSSRLTTDEKSILRVFFYKDAAMLEKSTTNCFKLQSHGNNFRHQKVVPKFCRQFNYYSNQEFWSFKAILKAFSISC